MHGSGGWIQGAFGFCVGVRASMSTSNLGSKSLEGGVYRVVQRSVSCTSFALNDLVRWAGEPAAGGGTVQ